MTHFDAATWLEIAGALHFTQVPAMLMMPRVLNWKKELALLTPINRHLVRVVVLGIVICVLGLGIVVVSCAEQMVSTRIGRILSVFLAGFWSYRALAQWLVYGRIWPGRFRWAHWCLCVLFPVLSLLYARNFLSQS